MFCSILIAWSSEKKSENTDFLCTCQKWSFLLENITSMFRMLMNNIVIVKLPGLTP